MAQPSCQTTQRFTKDGKCCKQEENINKYIIYLWVGAGYSLDPFEVEAFNVEHAIDVLTAYLVNKGFAGYFAEETEFSDDEEAYGYGYSYIDATMDGADRPVYLRTENMKIECL